MRLEIPRMAILAVLVFLFFISFSLSKFLEMQQTSVMQGIPHPEHVRDLETATQPCIPQNSVYFLKIPKCASTTSLHIFVAYGVKHGLTFALPPWIGEIPISPKILSPDYHGSPDGRYNMVVSHTQFNKEGAEQKLNVTLTDFIENSNHTKQQKNVMNKIASYFGIKDPSDRTTEKEMLVKAKWLNEIFDLVMIAERYDESLVLLKHLMCWDTEDIAYVKVNIRTPESRPEVSEAQKDKLRQLNRQDVFLYKFFREIFEKKVEAFGREKMQKEVEELRKANARFTEDCGATLTGSAHNVKTWEVKNTTSICRMISLNGGKIQDQLKERQRMWVSSNLTYDLLTWTFKG
ncbi:galactosylceramide sulfotransferase-like isoform X2 [Penaeus japonicus]|uniref:galactosylceramide sulfotransferase-like isoform X2 n=1 Tax=Penaeus japonicus TaxID=27405 RepID=UPI001C715F33|nr:galactosylceramide sulfotransferase-like isoform X2 [Penaeus japonicus]